LILQLRQRLKKLPAVVQQDLSFSSLQPFIPAFYFFILLFSIYLLLFKYFEKWTLDASIKRCNIKESKHPKTKKARGCSRRSSFSLFCHPSFSNSLYLYVVMTVKMMN